jgi:hypothetical protein
LGASVSEYSGYVGKFAGTGAAALGGLVEAGTVEASSLGAAPATLGITAAVAGVIALVALLLKGANPLQRASSAVEQSFVRAAQNLRQLLTAGMITRAQALAGFKIFLAAGIQALQNLPSQVPPSARANAAKAVAKGLPHISFIFNSYIIPEADPTVHLAEGMVGGDVATMPIDFDKAHALYAAGLAPGGRFGPPSGWEPGTIDAGQKIADHYLQTLEPPPDLSSQILGGATGAVGTIGKGISPTTKKALLIAGGAFVFWKLIGVFL